MINVAGVISIIIFYVLILGVGIWAGRKKEAGNDSEEEVMLAGRNIGLFVGIFTMTGTPPDTSFSSYLPFCSYVGRWRLHQRHGRDHLHHGAGLVPGALRVRPQSGLRRDLLRQ
jgi:hypothetical protein